MIVLGIETSCDETSASIITDDKQILSNVIVSQLDEHRPYGGVVPEIAARAHIDYLPSIIEKAIKDANISWDAIDGIAATAGPGLIGGVIVGLTMAKGLATALNKPFVGINHLEGHALTARLTHDVAFPYLLLLMSGGHTQIILVKNVGEYELLGTSIDDAVGEAFDKTAKMLNIGYPGGPKMEEYAIRCPQELSSDKNRYKLPRPLKGREGCDFSFSGLKTAVRTYIEQAPTALSEDKKALLALRFHEAVADVFDDRLEHAFEQLKQQSIIPTALVVAGGVAANKYLGNRLRNKAIHWDTDFIAPPMKLCTDNGAMIAWAGIERLRMMQSGDTLATKARPRWPLTELTHPNEQ